MDFLLLELNCLLSCPFLEDVGDFAVELIGKKKRVKVKANG